MDISPKKLRRLVDAQTTVEILAQSQVARLAGQLVGYEKKLELAKHAVSASTASPFFTDIHFRHIQRLVEVCSEVNDKLTAAQVNLQSEVVRTNKLRDRLRAGEITATRENENKSILERLDWSSMQR